MSAIWLAAKGAYTGKDGKSEKIQFQCILSGVGDGEVLAVCGVFFPNWCSGLCYRNNLALTYGLLPTEAV